MEGLVLLMLVFGIPIGGVLIARAIGLMHHKVAAIGITIAVGAAPGVILFAATRESDAITNAGAYFVAPLFALFGIILSSITAAVSRRA